MHASIKKVVEKCEETFFFIQEFFFFSIIKLEYHGNAFFIKIKFSLHKNKLKCLVQFFIFKRIFFLVFFVDFIIFFFGFSLLDSTIHFKGNDLLYFSIKKIPIKTFVDFLEYSADVSIYF